VPISMELSPRKVLLTLVLIIAALVTASTIAGAAWFFLDLGESGFLLVQLFWIDSEANIPSLYSFATLLASALLLAFIARVRRRDGDPYSTHWGVMAFIFVYLAFDEGASIHERTVGPVRWLLEQTPLPSSNFLEVGPAWIVLGALFVLVFVLAYLKFLLHLPPRVRNLMVLSGAIFVAGALGLEILSHSHAVVHGQENAVYALLATAEETLEMLGIALFIYTLLLHISTVAPRFQVTIAGR
jgi:hypothetical protein